MDEMSPITQESRCFLEMRRKVRESEVLSASMRRLLEGLRFSGRISVVLQNGKIVKNGYEEGYFRRSEEERLVQ